MARAQSRANGDGDVWARKLMATARESGDRFDALYVLALPCVLREGELLGLRWDNIA